MASLFPDGTLKNATCTSPRNSVDFNQSEDNFKTIEVFPVKCAVCIRCSANGPWASVGVTSEAETRSL